jgi:hypothetical protein
MTEAGKHDEPESLSPQSVSLQSCGEQHRPVIAFGGMAPTALMRPSSLGLVALSLNALWAGETTVYLSTRQAFSGTNRAFGFLGCRRARQDGGAPSTPLMMPVSLI